MDKKTASSKKMDVSQAVFTFGKSGKSAFPELTPEIKKQVASFKKLVQSDKQTKGLEIASVWRGKGKHKPNLCIMFTSGQSACSGTECHPDKGNMIEV